MNAVELKEKAAACGMFASIADAASIRIACRNKTAMRKVEAFAENYSAVAKPMGTSGDGKVSFPVLMIVTGRAE